jgi:Zn-dependent peptidase ImmA (M78 family)
MNAVDLYDILQIKYSYTFIGLFDTNTAYEVAGERIRQLLKIDSKEIRSISDIYDVFKFWKKKIEMLGILVFQFQGINLNEMRGFVFSELPYPTIVINQKDAVHARIFTLFHELTHIILNNTGICDPSFSNGMDEKGLETYCNYVAGAALVPIHEFLLHPIVKDLNNSKIVESVTSLSNYFKVSKEVILRRLLIGKKIAKDSYNQMITEFIPDVKKKDSTSGGGDFYNNFFSSNSNEYLKIIFRAMRSENISVFDTLTYLGVRYPTFETIQSKFEAEGLDK